MRNLLRNDMKESLEKREKIIYNNNNRKKIFDLHLLMSNY